MNFAQTELVIRGKREVIKLCSSINCGEKILACNYLHNLNLFRHNES